MRRVRTKPWHPLLNHQLQLRSNGRPLDQRVDGVAATFGTLLKRLLGLMLSPAPVPTARRQRLRPAALRRDPPARLLRQPLRQRLRLLQRAAAAVATRPPLPVLKALRRARPHPPLRLGLLALTTQERLGRLRQRARRMGPWLRDWLRQCYMPPRQAKRHRLRSCRTTGLRYWFRSEELDLLEPWQEPVGQAS
jgi:hypothetical protein